MSLVTMREILPYAEEKKIAIPAFNIDTMEITQAILETVEEENCPAIIAVGQAAIKDGKLESLAATVRTLAKDMKTPVVLHLDHGQSVEQVVKALCAGFTSVMIDGSKLSFEDNIAVTQEVVRIANAAGASVEAELGAILGSEDNISHDDSKPFLVRVQDVIDFTAQLFGLKSREAALKLADDFGIPYSGRDRGSPQNRRSVSAKKPEPTPEELWQKKHLRCLRAYLDYLSLLLEWKEQYAPKTRTEEWHEKFMTALRELSVVEYYLDILLFGDRADKEALVKEKWKEVERIEQCEREDKGDRHKRTERCHERNVPDGR